MAKKKRFFNVNSPFDTWQERRILRRKKYLELGPGNFLFYKMFPQEFPCKKCLVTAMCKKDYEDECYLLEKYESHSIIFLNVTYYGWLFGNIVALLIILINDVFIKSADIEIACLFFKETVILPVAILWSLGFTYIGVKYLWNKVVDWWFQ